MLKINKSHLMKIILLLVCIFIYYIFNVYPNFYFNSSNVKTFENVCTFDKSLYYTEFIYNYFSENWRIKKYVQIFSFGMLDLNIIILAVSWIMLGKNWRPLMTFILFLVFKQFCSLLFEIKTIDNMIWEDTQFPSIVFSYRLFTKYDQLFFSGSIGIYLICCLEIYSYSQYSCFFRYFSYFSFLGFIFHFFFLISLKANYYLSLICGIIAAHYFHIISDKYNYFLSEIYDFQGRLSNFNLELDENRIKQVLDLVKKKTDENRIQHVKYDRLSDEKETDTI